MAARRLCLLSIGIAVGLMSLGAAPPPAVAQKTLTVGIPGFPDSLSTGISSFTALTMSYQTMDPLVLRDDAGKLLPGLAESWQAVDNTTWRFALRRNVRFHDGSTFTADDVKGTIDWILDPKTTYGTKSRIAQIDSVAVIDPYTVEIKTKAPFPTLINGLSDIPMESKAYREAPPPAGGVKPPMGTGPFRYVRWVPGDRYELAANKDYWQGSPKIERLVLRQIPEPATRVASLLADETQIIQEVPIDLLPRIRSSRNAEVASVETSVGFVLTYDTRKPPFDNPKVRLALDLAVNKQLILDQILNGQGTVLQGQLLTSNTFGFNPAVKARPHDPAMAKRLLAEAGYPNGFTTSISTRSGRYLSDMDITNAIVGMFGEVGVRASINLVEGGVWTRMARAQDMGPMHMVGWFSLGDADFATIWYAKAGERAFWTNDEYERLFVEARSTVDQAAREKAYHRMMEILHEQNPSIFLFGLPSISAKSKRLTGWNPSSDTILRLVKADLN